MAKPKWIFGTPQPTPPSDDAKLKTPVVSSADAKKFGLENFGNTCYANSVLQALYFCSPFRDLILQSIDPLASQDHLPFPSSPATSPTPGPPVRRKPERKQSIATSVSPLPSSPPTLYSALRSLFLYISKNPADKGTVAPRAFIDKLKEVNELFRSNLHQDAHEFLNYLLNKIVEEIEEEKRLQRGGTPSIEDLSNSVATLTSKIAPTIITATTSSNSGTSPQDATLVHKLFEGVLTSETRCLTCETVSSRDESFLDLSIDIEQNSSVTACLRQFSASEMLCQKNKFFCDSCCDLQEAEKRMKIKKLPNVLALHLKRFKYQEDVGKYIKLAYRVAFPFELRLFNTVDDTDDPDRLYELFGIVVHIGNGPHHGHYISIIKTMGIWMVFDDDNVDSIKESEIPKYFGESNSGSAYVLYYQAVDIDLNTLGLRIPSVPETTDPLLSQFIDPPASPQRLSTPAFPPGLVEDYPKLNDPPILAPVLPPTPPLVPSVEASLLPLGLDVSQLEEATSVISSSPTTLSGKGSMFRRGSLLNSIGGTSGPSDRKRPAVATAPVSTPPSVPSNGTEKGKGNDKDKDKDKDKEKEKIERKSSTWFKRKSFKVEKSWAESNGAPTREKEDEDSTSSAAWFRTSAPLSKKVRRPSEPNFFDVSAFQTMYPIRPKSTAQLPTKLDTRNLTNGNVSHPPSSASSSFATSMDDPTTRRSPSFGPDSGRRQASPHRVQPEQNMSPPQLTHDESISSANGSPRDGASTPGSSGKSSRSLPPVPSLPSPVLPLKSNGHAPHTTDAIVHDIGVDKGKNRADISADDVSLGPQTSSTHLPVGAIPFSGVSHSNSGSEISSTGNGNSSMKRATRKLSLTAPMLGFGKKDKDKQKKEKDKHPPNSFAQHPVASRS